MCPEGDPEGVVLHDGHIAELDNESTTTSELLQAHDSIEALPEGYDTLVGQGGHSLSGGQRQPLGIARAMVRDARVLILDEPGSGLDAESERLVFTGLDRLLAGKTTFVIAHQFTAIEHADLILVLDQGRIVERGTHRELTARNGLYAKLLQLQRRDEGRSEHDQLGDQAEVDSVS